MNSNTQIDVSSAESVDGVSIGDVFEAAYADSMIEYTVTAIKNEVVFADASENDWGITERPFGLNEARRAIAWKKEFSNAAIDTEKFWNDAVVGTVLHYHNGFQQFLRGEIVLDGDGKYFKPLALVGEWRENELPFRTAEGEIVIGYHARSVLEGKLFRPNPSSIFELMDDDTKSQPRFKNVTSAGGVSNLEPAILSIPEMTSEEEKSARIEKILANIPEAISRHSGDLSSRVDALKSLVEQIEQEMDL